MELHFMPEVKIIADSLNLRGERLTTFQLRYQRFIHAELMTHRVFSRNASSSRAIPVKKMLEQVRNEPAAPCHWGKNQKGMQADQELSEEQKAEVQKLWAAAAVCAAEIAEKMESIGVHKQVANRILEPFQFISVVVSTTDVANLFELRCHPDAQPEFKLLADMMKERYEASVPTQLTEAKPYHLPYIQQHEWKNFSVADLIKFSVARCARVSYLTHDKKNPSPQEDIDLYDRLVGSRPLHASPTEHQARSRISELDKHLWSNSGNFSSGWTQFRKHIEENTPEKFIV